MSNSSTNGAATAATAAGAAAAVPTATATPIIASSVSAAAGELSMFGVKQTTAGTSVTVTVPTGSAAPATGPVATAAPAIGPPAATAQPTAPKTPPQSKPKPAPAGMSAEDLAATSSASSGTPVAADVFATIKKEAIDPYVSHLHDGTPFDFVKYRKEYMNYYDLVFQACSSGLQEVNPQSLYHNYVDTLEGFVTSSANPKMEAAVAKALANKEAMDESLLTEFKSAWDKQKLLVQHLVKMFLYLDRCNTLTEQRVLPLREQGHHVFRVRMFDLHSAKIRDALIKGLEIPADKVTEEQKTLLQDSLKLMLEVGKAFGDPYIQNMERILKDDKALKSHLKDMFTDTHKLLLEQQPAEPPAGAQQPIAGARDSQHKSGARQHHGGGGGGHMGGGDDWGGHYGGGGYHDGGGHGRGGSRGGGAGRRRDPNAPPIACQACTMINPGDAYRCEVCQTVITPLESRPDYVAKKQDSKSSGSPMVMGGGKAQEPAKPDPAATPMASAGAATATATGAATPAATAAPPAAESSIWVCKACTFRNNAAFQTCNMCDAPKS